MFYFPGCACRLLVLHSSPNSDIYFLIIILPILVSFGSTSYLHLNIRIGAERFPYSEISGSKVARHLPEAYRSQATSFIAF